MVGGVSHSLGSKIPKADCIDLLYNLNSNLLDEVHISIDIFLINQLCFVYSPPIFVCLSDRHFCDSEKHQHLALFVCCMCCVKKI